MGKKNLLIVVVLAIGLILGCKFLSNKSIHSNLKELVLTKATGEPARGEEKISGKVAIVITDLNKNKDRFDRFSDKGEFDNGKVEKTKNFFPPDVYAQKLDEINTLIKIGYMNEGISVEVIDYKTKKITAKIYYNIKEDGGYKDLLTSLDLNNQDKVNDFLLERASDFLAAVPNDAVPPATPKGEVLNYADLISKYEKSKDSIKQYEGKDVSITGYNYGSSKTIGGDYFTILRKDAKFNNDDKFDYGTCSIRPVQMVSFSKLRDGKWYKLTVFGKLGIEFDRLVIKNCLMSSAEEVPEKK